MWAIQAQYSTNFTSDVNASSTLKLSTPSKQHLSGRQAGYMSNVQAGKGELVGN
jgi:hypothetical protein